MKAHLQLMGKNRKKFKTTKGKQKPFFENNDVFLFFYIFYLTDQKYIIPQ